MDSELLATFVTVHRTGSISNAARALFRSQPAISRRIALLEQALRAPLFERAAGGLALSEAGRTLLPFAERAVAVLVDARSAMQALHEAKTGTVTIAVVGTLADAHLTATLRRFRDEAPDVEIGLRTATSAEVSALVRSGSVTIGLRYLHDPSPELACRTIASESLVIACSPDHRHAGRRLRSVATLGTENWLAFPRTTGRTDDIASIIEAHFTRLRLHDIALVPVDSLTAQKRLVEAGFGIALVPESAVREELQRGTLAVIRARDMTVTNPIVLATRRAGFVSPATRRFMAHLVAAYGMPSGSGRSRQKPR